MDSPGSFSHGAEGGKSVTAEHERTVGQYLRQEREKRGVPLEQVAKVTRITKENLEALEKDDFQAISAPVFVRGFLRNYAVYLCLDPQELVARYDSQTDLIKTPGAKETPPPSKDENPVFKYLLSLGILLAVVAIIYYLQQPSVPPSPPLPSTTVAPPPSAGSPSPAPGALPSAPQTPTPSGNAASQGIPPEKEGKPPEKTLAVAPLPGGKEAGQERRHVLKVITTEKTWMRIVNDENQVSDVLLQPNETFSWTARRQFRVTVGNAGGIELFWDGISQGRLGKSGEVVHLVLPRETGTAAPPIAAPSTPSPPPKDLKPPGSKPSREEPSAKPKPPAG
jgi:cytoskeleton protein RodZ